MKIKKLYFVILFILMSICINAHQNDSIFTFKTVETLYPVLSKKTPDAISFLVANYSDAGNEFYLNYNSNKTRYLDSYIAEDGDVAGWILLNFN
jgi:chloramphenicol O-acetyltransferase